MFTKATRLRITRTDPDCKYKGVEVALEGLEINQKFRTLMKPCTGIDFYLSNLQKVQPNPYQPL